MYEGLRTKGITLAFFAFILTGSLSSLYFANFTPWVGWGIALALFILWHFKQVSNKMICLPHLIVIIQCVQLIFASWYMYFHKTEDPTYHMLNPPNIYFSFSVLCCLSLFLGLFLFNSRINIRMDRIKIDEKDQATIRKWLDRIIITGILFLFFGARLGFVGILIANLRYVALLIYIILQLPKWKQRLLIVLAMQVLISIRIAMFHEVMLWAASVGLFYIYRRKINYPKIILVILATFLIVATVLLIRDEYRSRVWGRHGSVSRKARIFTKMVFKQIQHPGTLFGEANMMGFALRLNQGWIVDKILQHVPANEPYARGETVLRAIYEGPFPRVAIPEKLKAGGREYFERFTGHYVEEGTSMNLSISGELYANFGRPGAIAGMFIYGALISYILMRISRKARDNPLWLVWIPYLLLPTLKAEDGLTYFVNWFIKAFFIMVLFVRVIPVFRKLFLKLDLSKEKTKK